MKKRLRILAVSLLSLFVLGFGTLVVFLAQDASLSQVPGRLGMLVEGAKRDISRGEAVKIPQHFFWRVVSKNYIPGKLGVGDVAPNSRLLSLDGKSETRVSQLVKEKPLVLIFGSYT